MKLTSLKKLGLPDENTLHEGGAAGSLLRLILEKVGPKNSDRSVYIVTGLALECQVREQRIGLIMKYLFIVGHHLRRNL